MFVTQEQRKMERITTQDIVNREKNKLERLKQDEEDEEDVGLMGKILGFFSGKKSNRESPQKSKILLQEEETSQKDASLSNPKRSQQPVNDSVKSSLQFQAQDQIVDFRQRGSLNWLPNNQTIVKNTSNTSLEPVNDYQMEQFIKNKAKQYQPPMMPFSQQLLFPPPSNDVFNYTFNKNKTTDQLRSIFDPYQRLNNMESRRDDLHFRINKPIQMEGPVVQLDRLEQEMSQKYLKNQQQQREQLMWSSKITPIRLRPQVKN